MLNQEDEVNTAPLPPKKKKKKEEKKREKPRKRAIVKLKSDREKSRKGDRQQNIRKAKEK